MKKSILDIQISAFSSYKSKDPKNINLLTWLNSLKYEKQVNIIRNTKNPELIKKLKSELPAITPSGIFKTRKASELMSHSGFLQFDIDFKDNTHITNYKDLKKHLQNLKEVAYCGLSVSGKGYWGLIPIKHPEKHKEHFNALYQVFNDLGIIIDKSCKDVCRLRGYSIDKNAYFNHQAEKFNLIPPPIKKSRPTRFNYPKNNLKTVSGNVEKALKKIQQKQIDITGNYEDWFSLGCSLANEFGETGRNYFHSISTLNNNYNYQNTEKQFDYCIKNKYSFSISTFFYYCKLNGIE